ncbi:nuclear transport factor 2 family protein [Baekduia soli]|uniref:Nuclear transport factor 2 family protein n=1 Tax=Baekduia soli TaxID=496014 RepID=A0A5B8U7Y1_9ACTN|nr:nuclear transport factor 2 family protein [Baekduia soli]QEC49045.1 nuclear transport factor 2 family protein [Baekduia soli]
MTDITDLVTTYIAVWNEGDADRRRALVAQAFSPDAAYLDPLMEGRGHDGIDAMVAGAQAQFPGHRFVLAGAPDAHHDRVRFAWHLVPEDGGAPAAIGIDFATLDDDGRLRAVTGFLEPV